MKRTKNSVFRDWKGLRLTKIATIAISLLATAGVWYGYEKAAEGASNAQLVTSLSEHSQSQVPGQSTSSDGHIIPQVPGAPTDRAPSQKSGAADFARSRAHSRNSAKTGSLHVSTGKEASLPETEREEDLVLPEWEKIIHPDGTAIDSINQRGHFVSNQIPDYVDLYSAFEAGYIEEVISNGVATDMSALLTARDVEDEVLYNGAVSAAHDLGNAYYLLALSPMGNLRFYFGVERLADALPTFIEFELNQGEVRVGSGVPWWEIQGTRQDGDLLVRFNLISGSLTSVELAVWHEGGYLIFDSDTQGLGQGCTEHFSYAYCIGAPPIDRSGQEIEVWDEEYLPVAPTLPNSFVELALDMTRLMESGTEFSSIVFRTPEDVALSSFAGIGARARSSFGGL